MAQSTRERMVEGAIELLATKGVNGSSVNQVLEFTNTPRGSVYHHFPGGRNELLSAALSLAAQRHDDWVTEHAGASPESVVAGFLAFWRRVLLDSGLQSGCPVLAVTVAAPDGELFEHAGHVFRASLTRLADLLKRTGLSAESAQDLATFLVAAAEGGVVLARAQRSLDAFEVVAANLLAHTRQLDHARTSY